MLYIILYLRFLANIVVLNILLVLLLMFLKMKVLSMFLKIFLSYLMIRFKRLLGALPSVGVSSTRLPFTSRRPGFVRCRRAGSHTL